MKLVPLYCQGKKCMVRGCTNLASHKIAEVNVFDEETQLLDYGLFAQSHELTTYLCDEHFKFIMTREEKHNLPDNRIFE